jgi:hypothetical protein
MGIDRRGLEIVVAQQSLNALVKTYYTVPKKESYNARRYA